jgi:metallo-beta-lactamase family protein
MRIRFLGAARGVTGSMHLVEAASRRFLLDCGLFQGRRQEAYERNVRLRVRGEDIDFVVLSHAHIDHCGSLPTLCKSGFRGRIHATRATVDLAATMLRDSAQIQVRDVKYLRGKGRTFVEPLYTAREAAAVQRRMVGHDYDSWVDLAPGLRLRFQDAGHIIGSASVHLEVRERNRELLRLTFTGDFGRPHVPILRDPAPLPEAEVLITESTYGDRRHGEPGLEAGRQMKESLEQALRLALRASGKLIIPAFSVGRTQNILYFLNELMEEGRVPRTRVFLDSPLSVAATEIVSRHPECFDAAMREKVRRAVDPLLARHIELVRTVAESKAINRVGGTAVIVAASGMCEFGRILHHLAHNLGDPAAVIAFVGYQAEHTLGRRILEDTPPIRIYGQDFPIRARIVKLNGFSAHADKDELLQALLPLRATAGHTLVVHGEPTQSLPFADSLTAHGFRGVLAPEEGQEVEI